MLTSRFTSVVLSALGLWLAGSAPAEEIRRVALLVGVDHYEKRGFSDLRYAESDMRALASMLEHNAFEVILLTGSGSGAEAATYQGILDTLSKKYWPKLRELKKTDISLIAFAGHGRHQTVRNGNSANDDHFYCPADAHDTDLNTWISISDIIAGIEHNSGSECNLLFVDACRDNPSRGRGVDGKGFSLNRDAVAVLFASSYNEQAYEHEPLRHGLFTHYVLEALGGAAKNSDDQVTWDSLVDFVKGRVESESRRLKEEKVITGIQRPNSVGNLKGQSPILVDMRIIVQNQLLAMTKDALNALKEERLVGSSASKETVRAYWDLATIAFEHELLGRVRDNAKLDEALKDIVSDMRSITGKDQQRTICLLVSCLEQAKNRLPPSTRSLLEAIASLTASHRATLPNHPKLRGALLLQALAPRIQQVLEDPEISEFFNNCLADKLDGQMLLDSDIDKHYYEQSLIFLVEQLKRELRPNHEDAYSQLRSRIERIAYRARSPKIVARLSFVNAIRKGAPVAILLESFQPLASTAKSINESIANQTGFFLFTHCDCGNESGAVEKIEAAVKRLSERNIRAQVILCCNTDRSEAKLRPLAAERNMIFVRVKEHPVWYHIGPLIIAFNDQAEVVQATEGLDSDFFETVVSEITLGDDAN